MLTANPSNERTATSKPASAAHVERLGHIAGPYFLQWKRMNGMSGRTSGIETTTVGMLAVLLVAGCIVSPGVEETILPARIDYTCAKGRVLQVARSQDALYAAVVDEGKEIVLRRMDSAAQEKYGDGRYVLYLDAERAMLERDSQVLYGPCVSPVPLPSAPRYR